LIIGSIKSNIGHSENAAGISGLIKAVMAVEKGIIPGNPTFITPNPKIDFQGLKVKASRTAIPWPDMPSRIASVNSFGYGGSNAHVVLQDAGSFLGVEDSSHVSSFAKASSSFFDDDDDEVVGGATSARPHLLVFSANDQDSMTKYIKDLQSHLLNPAVTVQISNLAHTLGRRSRLFNRAFLVSSSSDFDDTSLVVGKKNPETPRIGFVFTGQGAQWSQMGKGIVGLFPQAESVLARLDNALQSLPHPPSWSLRAELVETRSPEHLRLPEFSQPLVTALQLVMLDVLQSWGIAAQSVVGHSSGEIAAACAAGLLTPEDAIKIAFFRGQAAKELQQTSEAGVGMMAVGLGPEDVTPYMAEDADSVQIACYNSPSSVTLSGKVENLNHIKERLQEDGHFARLLQVNLAYHSKYMSEIGDRYLALLHENCAAPLAGSETIQMFSSVTGSRMVQQADPVYWKTNMVSPVRFNEACSVMLSGKGAPDFLVEIGPSGALAGPIGQIKKSLPGQGSSIQYAAAAKRGPESALSMYDVAGRLFIAGADIDVDKVNYDDSRTEKPMVLVDLPNYSWNHSTKYWYESDASKEWRYRPFVHHDLLGSKILNAPWHAPTFRKILDLRDVPWLIDHKMGSEIVFPGAAFCAMAIEAMYQCVQMTRPVDGVTRSDQLRYRLRNIKFERALVLQEDQPVKVTLTLSPHPGSKEAWYDFRVLSHQDDAPVNDHCHGLIRIESTESIEKGSSADLEPLRNTTKAAIWYKALADAGYGFGPAFIKHLETESVAGERRSRSYLSLTEPESKWSPQSLYPMHPACMDGCFQTVTPSAVAGIRSSIRGILVPAIIDDLIINPVPNRPETGLSCTTSEYVGKGRLDDNKNYMSGCTVYDPDTGALLLKLTGLRYNRLDTDDKSALQTYTCLSWNPDVSLLQPEQYSAVEVSDGSTRIDHILDLLAHKKPTLNIMEANMSMNDKSSLWLQAGHQAHRAAYREYLFASCDPTALVAAQEDYQSAKAVAFDVLDLAKPDVARRDSTFDLVIAKRDAMTPEILATVARNARALLADSGSFLAIETFPLGADSTGGVINGHTPFEQIPSIIREAGFADVVRIPCDSAQWAYLCSVGSEDQAAPRGRIDVARLSYASDPILTRARLSLEVLGWTVVEHVFPFSDLQPGSPILILDELARPVLASVSPEQWDAIKEVTCSKRCPLLWVTVGSQFRVQQPDNALVHGFFRTIRAEDPSLRLTTLDVEEAEGPATTDAIDRILRRLQLPAPKSQVDNEYVERGGVIHISRITVDDSINKVHTARLNGAELQERSLHDLSTTARLQAERVGTLESLHYGEISATELPVRDGCLEVEVYAAGLNFKDVAVTMGIVPENERLLGVEGAGVVRRVGKGVPYSPGDRVVVFEKGCFANRIQVTKERAHLLPDSMSFEDAATLLGVYLTSLYALFNLANLRRGQSVLIHSAAGGVGISSIHLAKYVGAEIYVTVGSEEKRQFLHENYGIPYERMFSSRTTQFATGILAATNGRGVDVVLNSLTGELLDESWRICADGGTMVEIGKKDVLDRNKLSMEPFDRNCSFRALDFSHKTITDALIAEYVSSLSPCHVSNYPKLTWL
jgi:acyl transferase domain-containing protein/NADPH:quinone reductase-like Zn-dependent oxidoreductase